MDLLKFSTSRTNHLRSLLTKGQWPQYFFGESGRQKSFSAALIYAEWPLRRFKTGQWINGEWAGADRWEKGVKVPDERTFKDAANFCQWWTCGELYPLMTGYENQSAAVRQKCEDCDLIVLDDIADRNMTDARRASLLDILNWRGNKPLILTGNYDPKKYVVDPVTKKQTTELKMALQDDRLVGRILRCYHQRFSGPDLRMANLKVTDVPQ